MIKRVNDKSWLLITVCELIGCSQRAGWRWWLQAADVLYVWEGLEHLGKMSQKMNLGQENNTLGWFWGTLALAIHLSRSDDSSQTCASGRSNVQFNYMTTNYAACTEICALNGTEERESSCYCCSPVWLRVYCFNILLWHNYLTLK